eukprot:634018-Rhodomonas_salina.2
MEYTRSTVAGVAGAVLVPVAAVWMVSAAGFGSAGIVASSWAAKWMSAQALANVVFPLLVAQFGAVPTLTSVDAWCREVRLLLAAKFRSCKALELPGFRSRPRLSSG